MSKLLSVLLLSLISIFTVQDNYIFVESNFPGKVYAGGTYSVELTIHKQNLKHYATLTQYLPQGFSAIEKQSGAANFSYNKGELNFTWLRLPESSSITISYDIMVDATIQPGTYKLPAEFVYTHRNLRGAYRLKNSTIRVYRKGEAQISDTDIPNNPNKTQVVRFKPTYSALRRGLLVKLMISRGSVEGKSKITENIPFGYKATAIESKGAYFQVNNNSVEFIWNKMPESQNFTISYLLSPHKEHSPLPDITGRFRFLQNNQLRDVPTKQLNYENNKTEQSQPKSQPKSKKDIEKEEVMDYFGN